MTHLQYLPGDPRLVDQLVNELKSKGLFDQFRKECIADVDTKPAYQNLRQRVETSVAAFLFRQHWKPDMNKNQLREKLRKHILDGNYLEQGLERIVDQVVNPKVASVFIPQVEDLVYNYLGIARKKTNVITETSIKETPESLLPTDLEAVSPGSVKSDSEKETMETASDPKDENEMEVDVDLKLTIEDNTTVAEVLSEEKTEGDTQLSGISDLTLHDSDVSLDNTNIPLPSEHIKPENIPPPVNSPPKIVKIELEKIQLPREPNLSTDIPLPDEIHKEDKEQYFKPINSEDDSSSDSSLRRNMSPLTPIRNFINENSCDAQQAFENNAAEKSGVTKEPSSFRFTIEKTPGVSDGIKTEKKDDQTALSYQFTNQININTFNTPLYDDSSNSNHLRIDYESDANSKTNNEKQPEVVASQSQIDQHSKETKKEKIEERKNVHKSSHRSRDSHRYSSNSKDRRSDSKHSSSRDKKDTKNEKKSRYDHNKTKHTDKPKEKCEKKDSTDSSKHRSSSHKSSNHKDSKPHRSSSSSSTHRHSSKHSDDKKTSNHKDKNEKSSDKTSKDKNSKDSRSTAHRSDKDKKSSSSKSKHEDKEKKEKKDTDDHYSLSGRGNPNRRSTDRDSNDGSSSSKGSHNQPSTKSSESKNNKSTGSKSENTSTSSDSTGPSDNDHIIIESANERQSSFVPKPIIRIDSHLGIPISNPPRLPFVPDITLRKPKFAANFEEAKKMMKMRKFLDEEQRRMNQEAALLLEFQANVRPSLSQVYSSVPGPELEFICERNLTEPVEKMDITYEIHDPEPEIAVQVNTYEHTNKTVLKDNQREQEKKIQDVEAELEKPIVKKTNNEILHDIALPYKDKRDFNTFTLKYSDSHNLNISKEYIAEVIGINALEANVEVEKNQENERSPREAPIEIIDVDDEEDNKKYFEVTIINEPEDDIDRNLDNAGNSNVNIGKDVGLNKNDQSVCALESINIGEINKEYIAEVIGINNLDNNSEIDKSIIVQKPENVILDDEYKLQVNKDTSRKQYFEVTVITEEVSEEKESENENQNNEESNIYTEEQPLEYFGEQEKFNAEIEKEKFDSFMKTFTVEIGPYNKIYLINCDAYEEKIFKEVSESFGRFEVVNYHKNGCLKLPKPTKNVVKNVNINMEIQLPVERHTNYYESTKSPGDSPLFSPIKSEYSFDIPTDYNAKLDEMMKKASKRDIMEIILGIPEESPSKEPKIDYCSDSNLESDETNLKRKLSNDDCPDNNNKNVLTPKKMRRLSGSDQISSTTEGTEESVSSRIVNNTRSKYLGKARRVGLPRPKRCILNSPSSDKSVENYEQNLQKKTPNGKLKNTPRSKVQRYDTSDLYKPKLHFLSRRNNIT